MEKEKAGLFRRLFGIPNEEIEEIEIPRNDSKTIVKVSSPFEETKVVPWDRSVRNRRSEIDSESEKPDEKPDVKSANEQDSPSWEELLNKISAPAKNVRHQRTFDPMEVNPVKAPGVESQKPQKELDTERKPEPESAALWDLHSILEELGAPITSPDTTEFPGMNRTVNEREERVTGFDSPIHNETKEKVTGFDSLIYNETKEKVTEFDSLIYNETKEKVTGFDSPIHNENREKVTGFDSLIHNETREKVTGFDSPIHDETEDRVTSFDSSTRDLGLDSKFDLDLETTAYNESRALNKVINHEPQIRLSTEPEITAIQEELAVEQPEIYQKISRENHELNGLDRELLRFDSSPDPTSLNKKPEVRLLEKPVLKNEHVLWLMEQAKASGGIKAQKLLEIAFGIDQHPDVSLALAELERSLGNQEKATNYCIKSLHSFAENQKAVNLLVELINEGAKPDVDTLIAINSRNAKINTQLARMFMDHGFLTPALNFFTKAQALGLDGDEIQFELGRLHEQMDNPIQAKQHYQRALDLNKDSYNLETACRLFDIDLRLGLITDAKSVAKKYIADKDVPEVKLRLAKIYFDEGKVLLNKGSFAEALGSFYSAVEYGDQTANQWVVKTLLAIADNSANYAEAMEYYETALEVGGYNREIAEKIADKYLTHNDYVNALKYLRKVYEQDPSSAKIIRSYATCLQKMGEFDNAAELLETLATMGKLDKVTREQLFNYYRTQGRYADAKRHFELLHTPGTAAYINGLQALIWDQIKLLVDQGESVRAWEMCSEELRNNPTPDLLDLAMNILTERVDHLIAANKATEALQELNHGRALGLNVEDLALREAGLYESIGNDQAALRVYESIAKKVPEVWEKIKELYLKAATREYLAGNLAEARRLLEDAHAKLPSNEEIMRALGVLYQETGQYALAAALTRNTMEETDDQVPTDHLSAIRPRGYRRIRLG